MNMQTLNSIRDQLSEVINKETKFLWRLARDAQKRSLFSLADDIRKEADMLYHNMWAYPERILDWKFEHETKYAFRFSHSGIRV